jgi:hypothetical protein
MASYLERVINIVVNSKEATTNLEATEEQLRATKKETEGLEDSLDKMSGGAISGFKGIVSSTKSMVSGFGLLKTAWIATGFGALAVLILSLVEYFKNFEGGVKLVTKTMDVLGSITNNIVGSFGKLLTLDFKGFFGDIVDGAKDAASNVDRLFEAQQKLANFSEKAVIANAKLSQEIEKQKKITEDTTLSLETRLEAQEKINVNTEKLIKNERTLTELEKEKLTALLANENNYEKQRELKQQIADVDAKLINTETTLNTVMYDGEKIKREIIKAEQDRLKAMKDKSAEDFLRRQAELLKVIENRYVKIVESVNLLKASQIQLSNIITGSFLGIGTQLEPLVTLMFNLKENQIKYAESVKRLEESRDLAKRTNDVKSLLEAERQLAKLNSETNKIVQAQSKEALDTIQTRINTLATASNEVFKAYDGVRFQEEKEQLSKLNTEIFEFQKGFIRNEAFIDDRLSNSSNKYEELRKNAIAYYDTTANLKNAENKDLENSIKLEKDALKVKLEAAKKFEEDSFKIKDSIRREDFDSQEEFLLAANKANAEYNAAILKRLDLQTQINNKIIEGDKLKAEASLEAVKFNNERELELERLKYEEMRAMRDEQLEFESLFYKNQIGLLDSYSAYEDAVAQHGGKRSEKYAKSALALQKAAGIANVAVSLQEEIRGISSNKALTSLPDTGVAAKAGLIAAAIAKAGFSTATILKQRLGGGASSGGASGGSSSPANFNIVESSGNNQLASQIAQQQNQPVQAFVVGQAVTSQQALDRSILQNSTFL